MIYTGRWYLAGVLGLLGVLCCSGRAEADTVTVDQYQTLELLFGQATTVPANPFDTYLLRLELTDPDGQTVEFDGFYDGDGAGGQSGNIWKARISPSKTGTWSWQTIPGDAVDLGLAGLSGQFDVTAGSERGGLVANGRYFEFQDGSPTYLVGNFLDFSNGLQSTHVAMSETLTDGDRAAILARQTDFHDANKANIYLANKGDYGGRSVTPWVGSAASNDKTRMDLGRWNNYDDYIGQFKQNQMLADLWFFADDSNFGSMSRANQQRLIRYGMARTSAFNHSMYTLALEWQEGFTKTRINQLGTYLQDHNPWDRLVSVHSLNNSNWEFAGETWPTFIATQVGNSANPDDVNSYGITIRSQDTLPHIDEEYGVLASDSDTRLRGNLWANLASGAAGGGTGSDLHALQRFLDQGDLPLRTMTPNNGLVTGGGSNRFALADPGHNYLVYSETGSFNLNLAGSGLEARWFNPRDPNANLGAPIAVSSGNVNFTPPSATSSDWVLWVSDGTNIEPLATHPTNDATIVQHIVPGGPTVQQRPILSWEFNTDGDLEGWASNPPSGHVGVSSGTWNLVPSGVDPSLFGPTFSMDADLGTVVEIGMSSTDSSTFGQLFWKTTGDVSFSEAKSQGFTVVNNGLMRIYSFDLRGDPDWTGTTVQLRLDPVAVGTGGDVSIDFIRILGFVILGDMDCDGDVDFDDVGPFVLGLRNPDEYQAAFGVRATLKGDIDGDGDLDFDDIGPFVDVLNGSQQGVAQAIPEPSTLVSFVQGTIGMVVYAMVANGNMVDRLSRLCIVYNDADRASGETIHDDAQQPVSATKEAARTPARPPRWPAAVVRVARTAAGPG